MRNLRRVQTLFHTHHSASVWSWGSESIFAPWFSTRVLWVIVEETDAGNLWASRALTHESARALYSQERGWSERKTDFQPDCQLPQSFHLRILPPLPTSFEVPMPKSWTACSQDALNLKRKKKISGDFPTEIKCKIKTKKSSLFPFFFSVIFFFLFSCPRLSCSSLRMDCPGICRRKI